MKAFSHLRSDWFRYGFETLAVIVGILIAFGLENWNQERKEKKVVYTLLEEMVENLNSDIRQFERNIVGQNNLIDRIDLLVEHLENRKPYQDTLRHHFKRMNWYEDFFPISNAYESLKEIGVENKISMQLKRSIAHHYDVRYERLKSRIDRVNNTLAPTAQEFNLKYFRVISDEEGSVPTNYEALLDDQVYLNYLYNRRGWKINYIQFQTNMINTAKKLIDQINSELKS